MKCRISPYQPAPSILHITLSDMEYEDNVYLSFSIRELKQFVESANAAIQQLDLMDNTP